MGRLVRHPETGEVFADRRRENGSVKLIWWIMTVSVGLVITGLGGWVGNLQAKVDDHAVVLAERGELLAALRANQQEVLRRLTLVESTQQEMLSYWYKKLGRP